MKENTESMPGQFQHLNRYKIEFSRTSAYYGVAKPKKIQNWIHETIKQEGYEVEHINYILCSDVYLLKINKTYLNHDTYTDIITFDLSEKKGEIIGEIYISVPRVHANAKTFAVTYPDEMRRVMIHGALHLCGYGDKTPKEQKEMRAKEDHYLALLKL